MDKPKPPDTRCHCACHRTGPRSPSCSDCTHMHRAPDSPALELEALGSVATQQRAGWDW